MYTVRSGQRHMSQINMSFLNSVRIWKTRYHQGINEQRLIGSEQVIEEVVRMEIYMEIYGYIYIISIALLWRTGTDY